MRDDVWAVVLVKSFGLAKQRLATVLDEAERTQLARLMLEDVLSTLAACRHCLAGVIVVTADDEAAAMARRYQAVVLKETVAAGMNSAVARVVHRLSGRWNAGILVVPADLPHLSPGDIEEMLGLIRSAPAVALVRASSDGGTNLLACRPAGVIAASFGTDSFNRHCLAAAREGITPTVRFAPRLALDVDCPEDLLAFVALESATRTHAYLSELRIRKRVPHTQSGRRRPIRAAERSM